MLYFNFLLTFLCASLSVYFPLLSLILHHCLSFSLCQWLFVCLVN